MLHVHSNFSLIVQQHNKCLKLYFGLHPDEGSSHARGNFMVAVILGKCKLWTFNKWTNDLSIGVSLLQTWLPKNTIHLEVNNFAQKYKMHLMRYLKCILCESQCPYCLCGAIWTSLRKFLHPHIQCPSPSFHMKESYMEIHGVPCPFSHDLHITKCTCSWQIILILVLCLALQKLSQLRGLSLLFCSLYKFLEHIVRVPYQLMSFVEMSELVGLGSFSSQGG